MTEKQEKIINGLRNLNKSFGINDGKLLRGVVNSVTDDTVVEVEIDELVIPDVMLRAVSVGKNKTVTMIPAKGSHVIIAPLEGSQQYVVISYEELDAVKADIQGKTLQIDSDGLKLNGDDYGGLVKLKELEDNLNSLKDYVEAMKSAVSNGLSSVGFGTLANGANGKGAFELQMAPYFINLKNMENSSVKHG